MLFKPLFVLLFLILGSLEEMWRMPQESVHPGLFGPRRVDQLPLLDTLLLRGPLQMRASDGA